MTSTKFEEIMSKHNMHEKDEFKSIKSLNIFYQVTPSDSQRQFKSKTTPWSTQCKGVGEIHPNFLFWKFFILNDQ
jgi:hypothetical protein